MYLMKPLEYKDKDKLPRPIIFVAGGITGCSHWQDIFIDKLKDIKKGTLCNPRVKGVYTIQPKDQITWEFTHLQMADAVSFWFCNEGLCPIALYELGVYSQRMITKKKRFPIFLGVHSNFWRKIDIEIQMSLTRPDIKIVYGIEALTDQVRNFIETWKPPLLITCKYCGGGESFCKLKDEEGFICTKCMRELGW